MAASVVAGGMTAAAQAGGPPFLFGGGVVDPDAFAVTTFASGLPYPYGLAELLDGSLLVGVSVPTGGGFFSSVGELWRLADDNGDGVADGPPIVLVSGLPGAMGAVRVAGDLVFAVDSQPGAAQISVLRLGTAATDPFAFVGAIAFTYPTTMDHGTYGLAVRELPGAAGTYELFFNVGSTANDAAGATVEASGLTFGTLLDAAIYRVAIDDRGDVTLVGAPELIATGLRNAAGIALDRESGDLWFEDNGIDTPDNRIEALSADEVNLIPAAEIGGDAEDFGFPNGWVDYRSGEPVGAGGTPPVAAFTPLAGIENEGAADIALAPPGFPDGLNDGVFVGFHGQWDEVGDANEENPVAYVDRATGDVVHVVAEAEPAIGHLDGLLATDDALYLADLTGLGSIAGYEATGVIYRVAARG